MTEGKTIIKYNGKEIEVTIKELTFGEALKIITESTATKVNENGKIEQGQLNYEKYVKRLIIYSIKEVSDKTIKIDDQFVDGLSVEDGMKLIKIAQDTNTFFR